MLAALFLVAAVCPGQTVPSAHVPSGERLEYKLDLLGADVGTFTLEIERGTNGAAFQVKSRARTSAFVSTNVRQYDAFVSVSATKELLPLHYREDVDEGTVHKGAEAEFPPRGRELDIHVTTAGQAEDVKLDAGPATREMLTSLYTLRALPLRPGQKLCLEVYGGRRMWRFEGAVAAKESIDTPLGRFATVRIDAHAIRLDDPSVKRDAHVWITDDDRRLPLVALGEVRGKTIRAQLVDSNVLARKRAQVTDSHRNAIGR